MPGLPAPAAADDPRGAGAQALGRPRAVDRLAARRAGVHALRAAARQARAPGRRDARLLEARRRPRGGQPAADLRRRDRDPALHLPRPDVLLDRPDHQRQLPHRGRVRRRARSCWPELPGRLERADGRDRLRRRRRRARGGRGRRRPGRRGRLAAGRARRGRAHAAAGHAHAAALLHRGVRPDRADPRRRRRRRRGRRAGRRCDRGRVRRARRRGLGLEGDPADRARSSSS